MQVAVYESHEEDTPLGAILEGRVPSSGSVAGLLVFTCIARHCAITVYHRLGGNPVEVFGGVRWIQVRGQEDFLAHMKALPRKERPSFLVLRNHSGLFEICAALKSDGISIVVALNNGLSPELMQRAVILGVERFVVRSRDSLSYYKFFPFNWRVHLVRHAVPFSLPKLGGEICKQGDLQAIRVADRVLWVGATREEKGFHLVLPAWLLVRAAKPTAELHVFGSVTLHRPGAPTGWTGVMSPEFEQTHLDPIAKSSTELQAHGIVLHGARPRDEIIEFAKSSIVGVVNPNVHSSIETFCMSAVEIQAAGCPCVGGKAGGLLETIDDGLSGKLVQKEDPRSLAHAILYFLQNPHVHAQFSKAARIHAMKFLDLECEAGEWHRLFREARANTTSSSIRRELVARCVGALGSNTIARLAARLGRLAL